MPNRQNRIPVLIESVTGAISLPEPESIALRPAAESLCRIPVLIVSVTGAILLPEPESIALRPSAESLYAAMASSAESIVGGVVG